MVCKCEMKCSPQSSGALHCVHCHSFKFEFKFKVKEMKKIHLNPAAIFIVYVDFVKHSATLNVHLSL